MHHKPSYDLLVYTLRATVMGSCKNQLLRKTLSWGELPFKQIN